MNMRLPLSLLIAVTLCAQTLDKPTNFLIKLSDPIGGKTSKTGDKVGAVVISPETFLGGRFEGVVKQAGPGTVTVEFTTLRYKGKAISVSTTTTDFVNSKGHPKIDDGDRPLTIEEGVLTSKTPGFVLDEGSELKLQVTPAGR
jgi:hypothetical protein